MLKTLDFLTFETRRRRHGKNIKMIEMENKRVKWKWRIG